MSRPNRFREEPLHIDDLDVVTVNDERFLGIGYQGLLNVNTKTYAEAPMRSKSTGKMVTINQETTFIIPRVKFNFKYFTIADYRRLLKIINDRDVNEMRVQYFDKEAGEMVSHRMYCEPEDLTNIYNVGHDVFGVLDYTVSFIGTLNDPDEFMVEFDLNGGAWANGTPTTEEKTMKLYSNFTLPVPTRSGKEFLGWFLETDMGDKQVTFKNGDGVTSWRIDTDVTLKAVWL